MRLLKFAISFNIFVIIICANISPICASTKTPMFSAMLMIILNIHLKSQGLLTQIFFIVYGRNGVEGSSIINLT